MLSDMWVKNRKNSTNLLDLVKLIRQVPTFAYLPYQSKPALAKRLIDLELRNYKIIYWLLKRQRPNIRLIIQEVVSCNSSVSWSVSQTVQNKPEYFTHISSIRNQCVYMNTKLRSQPLEGNQYEGCWYEPCVKSRVLVFTLVSHT